MGVGTLYGKKVRVTWVYSERNREIGTRLFIQPRHRMRTRALQRRKQQRERERDWNSKRNGVGAGLWEGGGDDYGDQSKQSLDNERAGDVGVSGCLLTLVRTNTPRDREVRDERVHKSHQTLAFSILGLHILKCVYRYTYLHFELQGHFPLFIKRPINCIHVLDMIKITFDRLDFKFSVSWKTPLTYNSTEKFVIPYALSMISGVD